MMSHVLWYAWRSITHRLDTTRPIFLAVASGSAMAFVALCLATLSTEMIGAGGAPVETKGSIHYASHLILWMGVLVSFFQTSLLLQREVTDHYVELGVLVNLGIIRGIVSLIALLEYLGYAIVGGLAGAVFGLLFLEVIMHDLAKRLSVGAIGDILGTSTLIPCAAIVPVGAFLARRLHATREGVRRAR